MLEMVEPHRANRRTADYPRPELANDAREPVRG